jgi:hypothetical protein
MKIKQIIKEELTWSDVQVKFSGNTELLQYIMKAGQRPNAQLNGKTDWGSAIDMGSAEYQAKQQAERLKTAKQKGVASDEENPSNEPKTWSSNFRGNQHTGGLSGPAKIPGLKDIRKIEIDTFNNAITTGAQAAKDVSQIIDPAITYNRRTKQ